jgi:hypothetical protein
MEQNLEFEREKWRADVELRQRELALREREQANRDADIELKRDELASSKWRSPLVVAVFVAAGAAAGNALVAVVNGHQTVALENSKAESTRILEMIKTGDTEKAASNLRFLLQSGLVDEASRSKKLEIFLDKRKAGEGPSLPSAASRFGFEQTDALTVPIQTKIQNVLEDYIAYLDKIGVPNVAKKVNIRLERKEPPDIYYRQIDNTMIIDPRIADDPLISMRAFNHHALQRREGDQLWEGQYDAIESGLADYFACSFVGNPTFGEISAKMSGRPYVRLLLNERRFGEFQAIRDAAGMRFQGAEIWGGAFWAIRTRLGRDVADPMFLAAWQAMAWPDEEARKVPAFVEALVSVARTKGSAQAAEVIQSVLQARGFPVRR